MKINQIIVIISLIFSINLFSLPRYAVRLNDKCIDCHVNPTGGIIKNENGWFYGKLPMSMISPREKELKLSPKIADNILFGLDLRGQFLYSQEKSKTDFQDMTGAIYTNIKLSENIDVVTRYDFVWGIWEAYGIAKILPLNGYIKAGKFQPNFGIRIDDHTAYTRGGDFALLRSNGTKGLKYDPFYLETGAELGFYLDKFVFLTASVGRPNTNFNFETDPTYTTRLEITPTSGRLGVMFGGSFSNAKIKTSGFPQFTNNSNTYGGFLGIGYDRIGLLAEYDIADDYIGKGISSKVLMAQLSYQVMVGLEAIVRYDQFDPDVEITKDEVAHLVVGFEFFPYSFVEIRPQYRVNFEDPDKKNDAFVMQFHFWY
ncbi:MAG: hypothetical protein CVV23_17540 [Ignavibacteriae bacterium HGW-Ignavibacteriae-2]|jgi:hypothetical protein|nr:MAG: hypothetical protein CVV23_17540 [Ignavibacteriae bacterium HGW-Ignavibacteriae-2]